MKTAHTWTLPVANQCEWIDPNPLESMNRCSVLQAPGCKYCDQHQAAFGQKNTRLRKRHKDLRVAAAIWDLESEFNEAVTELIAEGELSL
jgi:hypothetical protein